MSAAELPVANSYATLRPDNPLRRRMRAPWRRRPAEIEAAFDAQTLFYDCFRHDDGETILLVGPPPRGLEAAYAAARFVARPSGATLRAKTYASLSVAVAALAGAPAGTETVDVEIAGERFALAVQPSATRALAGRRVLFSVNKDNELGWIREWALYHARRHGTDAVILFDNGSSRYGRAEIVETLRSVPGLSHVGVPVWPYPFGPIDPCVRKDPYWARFLQIGTMSVLLRRYGERAAGLLDCDIDELAGTHSGRSIYELARESKGGLVVFRGTWIEATGGSRHRDFTQRLSDAEAARSPQRKWALDPTRQWVRKLSVQPYWHWIEGRARFVKSMPDDALYWHFKGINTNWKTPRTTLPEGPLEPDRLLQSALADLSE